MTKIANVHLRKFACITTYSEIIESIVITRIFIKYCDCVQTHDQVIRSTRPLLKPNCSTINPSISYTIGELSSRSCRSTILRKYPFSMIKFSSDVFERSHTRATQADAQFLVNDHYVSRRYVELRKPRVCRKAPFNIASRAMDLFLARRHTRYVALFCGA